MLAAALVLFLQADTTALVDRITRLAASEPVEYGIDTRMHMAEVLAPRYPDRARRQLRDAAAALSGISDSQVQNMWRARLAGAWAPLDFDEAQRLAGSVDADRKNDSLAAAYDELYAHLGKRDRDEFIAEAIGAGAFRLGCATRRLDELLAASKTFEALALFSRIANAFPEAPEEADIAYLEDRAKQAGALDAEPVKRALKKAAAARAALPARADKAKNDSGQEERELDISGLSYADALERTLNLKNPVQRASALIELSRREDLTLQQQARVASEALTATGQIKLSDDRFVGLSMLSRDFVKRHEYANAAMAAEMLSESFGKACACGAATCNAEGSRFDCVEMVNAYAEYLDELHIAQESLGLQNISLQVRLLIFDLKKSAGAK